MGMSRSENMSRILATKTEPEEILRSTLETLGLKIGLGRRTPAGKADLVLLGRKAAIFVDGCFWHGCPHHYVRPRSSTPFWDAKLAANVARDRRQTKKLRALGWNVIRLWEHEVKEKPIMSARKVLRAIRRGAPGRWPVWRVSRVIVSSDGDKEIRVLCQLLGSRSRFELSPRSTAKIGRVHRLRIERPEFPSW